MLATPSIMKFIPDAHGLWLKYLIAVLVVAGLSVAFVHSQLIPSQQNNVCELFRTHPEWRLASVAAQKKWHVPLSTQMAIIHQESHFRAGARPAKGWKQRFLGGNSSALGYAQALNNTWLSYLRHNKIEYASRTDFYRATDFIAWYLYQLHNDLNIPLNDTEHLYLAYHEGESGYRSRAYQHKPWLLKVARQVALQADTYHQQMRLCR
jgi:hypothetical protein